MNVVLAQTGAPTAVVNRSVLGFLTAVGAQRVLLGLGGPDSLVNAQFTEQLPKEADLKASGSCLRGGRRAVTLDDLDRIVDNVDAHGISGISLIGGNGTMAFLNAIGERSEARKVPLRLVGIPKTIDNDLEGIDHSPGYASAARYLAQTVTDMVRDHDAMAGVEKVRIVETMGRDTGWLALAASYHLHDPQFAADLVLIPELSFSLEQFVIEVERILTEKGRAFIIVSEGVAPHLTSSPVKAHNHTQLIQGGISRVLAHEVTARLGVTARGEVIGTAQRSSSALASARDQQEAEELGCLAAQLLTDPYSPNRIMVSLSAAGEPHTVPLQDVAGHVRRVPAKWQSSNPRALTDFQEWIGPFIELT